MAVVWEKVQVGDVLYEVKRRKMGNTNISGTFAFAVEILEIDHDKPYAVIRWNGNAKPKVWGRSKIMKLRRSPPKSR